MTNLQIILIIQQSVEDHYNLERWSIDKTTKKEEIIEPRQVCVYLSRKHTGCTFSAIGAALGWRKSGTIRSNNKAVLDRLSVDAKFALEVEKIESLIKDRLHDINHVLG